MPALSYNVCSDLIKPKLKQLRVQFMPFFKIKDKISRTHLFGKWLTTAVVQMEFRCKVGALYFPTGF